MPEESIPTLAPYPPPKTSYIALIRWRQSTGWGHDLVFGQCEHAVATTWTLSNWGGSTSEHDMTLWARAEY